MHHAIWLASVGLLTTPVTAFYPYIRGSETSTASADHGSKHRRFYSLPGRHPEYDEKAGIKIDLTKGPSRVRKSPQHIRIRTVLTDSQKFRRDNNYPVVLSNPPDMKDAMAIDEDGNDMSYFASVQFGSTAKSMYMLIDTGAANTWVMGDSCASSACQNHNTFGSQESTTLNTTNETWNVSYGTGTVSGNLASDTVAFAGYSVELGFGLATQASNDFNNYPMDGILGMGRPSSDELGTPSVMQVLESQNLLTANIFGVHLQRNSDGTKDGQITFGAIDHSKFKAPLNYVNVVSTEGLWEIPADDATVNGIGCNFTGKSAIMDTGTSYILMPPSDAQAVHQQIPGSTGSGANYMIPCSTKVVLGFTLGGQNYAVHAEDFLGKPSGTGNMCVSNIIGQQAFGPNEWILGDVFLKNVYSVFDLNENRIGKSLCIRWQTDANAGPGLGVNKAVTPAASTPVPSVPASTATSPSTGTVSPTTLSSRTRLSSKSSTVGSRTAIGLSSATRSVPASSVQSPPSSAASTAASSAAASASTTPGGSPMDSSSAAVSIQQSIYALIPISLVSILFRGLL